MCQIIALKTTKKKFKKISKNGDILSSIENLLQKKGGDYYSWALISSEVNFYNTETDFDDVIGEITYTLHTSDIKKNDSVQILFFSRQQPEMELSVVQNQPYTTKINSSFIFAVHGTIHNDKELAKEYGVEIAADTEILQYMPISDWHKAEGSFTVIGIDECGTPMVYENGLKIWKNKLDFNGVHLADVVSTGSLNFLEPELINLKKIQDKIPSKVLMASFSGGMDIALSVYKSLSSGEYHSLIMNYFAWGSKAEEAEIKQLEKFKEFYSSEFPDIKVIIKLREAEYYFDEYFKINNALLPKISLNNKDSVADKNETESPLAYVPYRNTQFAILLASICEANNAKNVDIIFGLNLSEGMVFMDNSEGWLETISNTIKYGGKDSKVTETYNVISPYFSRTKTNMIKEFKADYGKKTLKNLLGISISCYYPDEDGTPCGECGSCILRKKSLKKEKNVNKEL